MVAPRPLTLGCAAAGCLTSPPRADALFQPLLDGVAHLPGVAATLSTGQWPCRLVYDSGR
eukprot:11220072-Alexandrium_andersonii.AAC.1